MFRRHGIIKTYAILSDREMTDQCSKRMHADKYRREIRSNLSMTDMAQ